MLGWALTFLIVALIAAVLGFGGIAGFAVEIAKIIFFVAIILFVISAIFGLMRGRSPNRPHELSRERAPPGLAAGRGLFVVATCCKISPAATFSRRVNRD